MAKVYAEVYGCAANMADGEIALGLLRNRGYEISSSPDEADLLLIVTCAVKKPTADRMISRIKKLSKYGGRLVVAGCMVSGEPERVRLTATKALLLTPREITGVADFVEGRDGLAGVVKLGLPRVRKNDVISIIPVAEGCRWSRCSFCIVPRSRPGYNSYPVRLVVEEVRRGLSEGCREFWLTSQDMGSYGLEWGRNFLPELLESVNMVEGEFYVRVGMMNPIYLKPIVGRLAKAFMGEHIFKFLHLPVQSGSDNVLRDMRRGHSVDLYRTIVETFRRSIPRLTLSTDIIVGYPTEDESDFDETLKLLEWLRPDIVNISRFFPRPGTPAEGLKPLPPRILSERVKALKESLSSIQLRLNESWIGWEGPVIIDEVGRNGTLIGRNPSYKPVVLNTEVGNLGKIVNVRVVGAGQHFLRGVMLNG